MESNFYNVITWINNNNNNNMWPWCLQGIFNVIFNTCNRYFYVDSQHVHRNKNKWRIYTLANQKVVRDIDLVVVWL